MKYHLNFFLFFL